MKRQTTLLKLLTGAKGASKYLRAIILGDFVDENQQEQRLDKCRGCLMLVDRQWCGPAFEDHTDHPDPDQRSCGCLVFAKTAVASESCPQKKWTSITIQGKSND